MYGCGKNSTGQLGLGHTNDVYVPTLVRSLVTNPVHDVAAGVCFTVVNEKDRVSLQQCGFVGKPDIDVDDDDEGYARTVSSSEFQVVVMPTSMSSNDKILAVSAGAYHCGALVGVIGNEHGGAEGVMTWGEGVHGALGHGKEERSDVPLVVEALEHCHAVQLSMGHEFSALLTTDDRLYVWGKGENGQLGNGYYVDALAPALAKSPGDDIHWVSISCGENHMMGVTGQGAPRFDPDENTFVRERHAKESALPSHYEEDVVKNQLQNMLGGLGNLAITESTESTESTGGSGGGAAPTLVQSPHVAPPPAASPPAAPTPSAKPTHWSYQDQSGAVQGPFDTAMMKAWYEAEMIHSNLQVRDANGPSDAPFVELGTLYPDRATSFQ